MKHINLLLALSLLFTVTLFSSVSTVEAQTEASDEAIMMVETTSEVFHKNPNTEKIKALRILYRDQVNVYRDAEKAYRIAKTNFENLGTLIALEEAVIATKQVMINRSNVLITYLELIEATLDTTAGVELSTKNESLSELRGLIKAIKIHQEDILATESRDGVNALSTDFEAIELAYDITIYKALSLIRIGRVQTVHDQAEIINEDIVSQQALDDAGALTISKRERAYNEVDRIFKSINSSLAEINADIKEAKADAYSRRFHENILKDLSPVYAEISKSLAHLEELLRI